MSPTRTLILTLASLTASLGTAPVDAAGGDVLLRLGMH